MLRPRLLTHTITDERIADLLIGALEGGSNYWIAEATVHKGQGDGKPLGEEYTPGYLRAPFSTGGWLDIDPGEGDPIGRLDRSKFAPGLIAMAKDSPGHFADFLNENDDATTADVFLQYCLFGKVVYS